MTDKITLPRSVVEQVLAAIETTSRPLNYDHYYKAINSLRAALEQPPLTEQSSAVQPQGEQEPVMLVYFDPIGWRNMIDALREMPDGTQLYTRPQPRRGPLTPKEVSDLWVRHARSGAYIHAFAQAVIESAYGIGSEA